MKSRVESELAATKFLDDLRKKVDRLGSLCCDSKAVRSRDSALLLLSSLCRALEEPDIKTFFIGRRPLSGDDRRPSLGGLFAVLT